MMLQRLSPEGNREGNSSFADMSLAIDNIVDSDEPLVEISGEHNLILACCWLNLKECSLLAAHLVDKSDLRGGT